MSWITSDQLQVIKNCLIEEIWELANMIDRCLSALATAWIITFVASTGLVAGLAMASAWDSPVYAQGLQAQ